MPHASIVTLLLRIHWGSASSVCPFSLMFFYAFFAQTIHVFKSLSAFAALTWDFNLEKQSRMFCHNSPAFSRPLRCIYNLLLSVCVSKMNLDPTSNKLLKYCFYNLNVLSVSLFRGFHATDYQFTVC